MIKISMILSFVIAFCSGLNAQTFEQIDYVISNDNIANPERGFYHQVNRFSEENLLDYKKSGVRLILKNYILKDFKNKPISADFLRDIQKDFDNIRNAGFKIIVRFAYTETLTTPYGDARPEIVLMHIGQLKNILEKNSDVILTLQAGFIGTWGEWYYTDYFSQSPGNITEKNWEDRRAVVDKLLNVLPKDRMVQLRTPTFIRQMQQEEEFIAIVKEKAFDGSKKSRLAFHNDCFVAGYDDWGTYQDIVKEKNFLEINTKYTIVGGETCSKSTFSNCNNTLKEVERLHWSFLNLDYHQGVLSQWRNEGCFDEIQNRLGYRYALQNANLQKNGEPGSQVDFILNIKNEGWANPTNEYILQIVLRDTTKNNTYKLTVDDDIRKWEIGQVKSINITAGLPNDIEAGEFEMFLSLKDKRTTLIFDNNYKIRFANEDVWAEKYGENSLNHIIRVTDTNILPKYQGTDYFIKEGTINPDFYGPKAMGISQYNDNNIIYWTVDCDAENQVTKVLRSTDNEIFTTIAVKNADEINYIDRNLNDNTTYYYKTQFVAGDKYSQLTSAQINRINPDKRQFLNIEIDGEKTDWNCVPPVITNYETDLNTLKLSNDKNNLYFSIEGQNINSYNISLYLDDSTTFRISNDSLFNENDDFIKTLNTDNTVDFIEGKVLMSDVDFENISGLELSLYINNYEVCNNKKVYYLKNKAINRPERFRITPSVVTPYSKVKISWKLDSNVDGYSIERSEGNMEHFELLKELSRSQSYYLDKDLDSSKVYFYRMFGFSDIVKSDYTDTLRIHLGTSDVDNQFLDVDCSLYPNPMQDKSLLKIKTGFDSKYSIKLFDSGMHLLRNIYSGFLNENKNIKIERENLKTGIYYVVISQKQKKKTIKLIIL